MRSRSLTALSLAAVLVLASCSSDGGSDADEASPGSTTTEAPTTTVAAPEPLEDQTAPASVNGLVVDGETLWLASIEEDAVFQVRISDGAILARVATEGAAPDDVDVAPDGSVWVTGFGNGDLGRIADGTYTVEATLPAGINPIAIDDDGIVSVASYGPDGSLWRLDPAELDGGEGPEPVASSTLPDVNAFDHLVDGRLFSPAGGIAGPGSAVAIDPATGEVEVLVEGLPGVAAATVDPDGVPYILANATGELFTVDVEAGTAESVRTVTDGAPFDNLAFADDGTLYLSSFTTPAVTEVSPDGSVRVIAIGS